MSGAWPLALAASGAVLAAPGLVAFADWQARGCAPWPIARHCVDAVTSILVSGGLALLLFGAAARSARKRRRRA